MVRAVPGLLSIRTKFRSWTSSGFRSNVREFAQGCDSTTWENLNGRVDSGWSKNPRNSGASVSLRELDGEVMVADLELAMEF